MEMNCENDQAHTSIGNFDPWMMILVECFFLSENPTRINIYHQHEWVWSFKLMLSPPRLYTFMLIQPSTSSHSSSHRLLTSWVSGQTQLHCILGLWVQCFAPTAHISLYVSNLPLCLGFFFFFHLFSSFVTAPCDIRATITATINKLAPESLELSATYTNC